MQNYYVAALAVSQGKSKQGFLTSAPEKSIDKATRDVIGRLGRYKALDLRVRLITPKEAKLIRKYTELRQRTAATAKELTALHDQGACVVAPAREKKTLAVRRKLVHKKVSRLNRRVKAKAKKV